MTVPAQALLRRVNLLLQFAGLIGKAGIMVPRYMLLRRQGVAAFEKELLRLGLDRDAVKLLSDNYKDWGNPAKWLKGKGEI